MEKSHGWGCGPFSWPLGAAPCWPSPEAAGQGSCPATCWPWLRPRPPPSIPSDRRIQRGHLSTTVYTFLTYLACFLTLLLGTAAAGTPLTGYGGREWLIGLALAVLCTLLGHSLFSWCLKYLSPSYVSAAKLCEPVFSSLAAIPLFGEVPGPLQLAGGAAVLGAVLLYTWAEREKTPAG